jgi:hypothetical protein
MRCKARYRLKARLCRAAGDSSDVMNNARCGFLSSNQTQAVVSPSMD